MREGTIWTFSSAGTVLLGLSFLLPPLDISQALHCPIYFPFSGLLFALFCASLFPSYAFSAQTVRHRSKRGCCRQPPGYRLCHFCNLTAQLHAIAGTAEELCPTGRCPWLCKYNVLSQPAKRGDAVGGPQLPQDRRILYLQERVREWRGRRNKGQRRRLCHLCAPVDC